MPAPTDPHTGMRISSNWIPAYAGMAELCIGQLPGSARNPVRFSRFRRRRAGGDPGKVGSVLLGSRLRGNDGALHWSPTGFPATTLLSSSPRRRGFRECGHASGFRPARNGERGYFRGCSSVPSLINFRRRARAPAKGASRERCPALATPGAAMLVECRLFRAGRRRPQV